MDNLSGKRLVIFGCGYVGTAVARWAAEKKMRITALTRNAASAVLLREIGVRVVEADLAGDSWHADFDEKPEIAVNCVSSGGGGIEGYRHSYLHGTESIVRWAKSGGGLETFLYTSSTSVYPQGDGALVDEVAPVVGATDRAQVLIDAEALVRSNGAAWRRWFILRLAGIYGPGRHALLEQVRSGEVAGVGEHHLNLIHRDDIVTAIAACLSAPGNIKDEIFNVTDDGAARKSEIVTWLANELGTPPPRFSGGSAGARRAITPDRIILNAKLKRVLRWRPGYSTFREGYANLLSP